MQVINQQVDNDQLKKARFLDVRRFGTFLWLIRLCKDG